MREALKSSTSLKNCIDVSLCLRKPLLNLLCPNFDVN
jgi:hypothetical protein